MLITGKGMKTSMDLRTKTSNKKQKAKFAITDNTNQELRKLINMFNNFPFLGYKSKQFHDKPVES